MKLSIKEGQIWEYIGTGFRVKVVEVKKHIVLIKPLKSKEIYPFRVGEFLKLFSPIEGGENEQS